MTAEEILLTVLTVSIVVLIAVVIATLVVVINVVRKVNIALHGAEQAMRAGTDMIHSFAPVGMIAAVFRAFKVMKKRK